MILELTNEFKSAVLTGLSCKNKHIASKFLYDTKGSQLFNRITRHPDYYLTQCELEILQNHKEKLSSYLMNVEINVIEFGPGEGIKTHILMQQFLKDSLTFRYFPIDLSHNYLTNLSRTFQLHFPSLNFSSRHMDYLNGLKNITQESQSRNLILFLGSSIGNFNSRVACQFLKSTRALLNKDDYMLIGFDLKKDIAVLMRAYNDHSGITRDFNLNLLARINRELQSNFNINKFQHFETFNIYAGAMESYLVSLEDQTIHIDSLNRSFDFRAFEPLHTEYSYKYLISQIPLLAKKAGFEVVEHFFDSKQFFVDSLWRAVSS